MNINSLLNERSPLSTYIIFCYGLRAEISILYVLKPYRYGSGHKQAWVIALIGDIIENNYSSGFRCNRIQTIPGIFINIYIYFYEYVGVLFTIWYTRKS